MVKKLSPYLLCGLLALISVLTIGCGKKQNEHSDQPDYHTDPQMTDLEAELEKQELFCGSDHACPSYLAKIAVLHKNKLKFCTGFLIKDDVIATASSCLPDRLRVMDLPCDKDVFFFFSESNQKPLRAGCEKVLDATSLTSKEPFLWRSNVSYLKLNQTVLRRTVTASRNGMDDMEKFYVWSLEQVDSFQGIIRKSEDCTAIYNSYFNPFATNQSSPVMLLAGCEFVNGNSGAPILDYRGKVRGVISSPVEESEIDQVVSMRILERPLKSLIHVSNYACAPMIPDQDVLNDHECGKQLNINLYDSSRREMISETNLFRSSIQKIEHSINEVNRYIKLSVKLLPDEEFQQVVVFPKCFKNVSKWMGEFTSSKPFVFNISLPDMTLKKAMNEHGKLFALENVKMNVPTNFQFHPRVLKNTNRANVYMWPNGEDSTTFPDLSEACGSLF